MGNRAILIAKGNNNKGVYLHWNGGRDSIEAFLKYCELKGFRDFGDDYGMARFCQVVGNYFGGGLSIGIIDDPLNWCMVDNGVYIIEGWEIVGRKNFNGIEQMEYDLQEMLLEIDMAQPKRQQLGNYLTAREVKPKELKIGDRVAIMDISEMIEEFEVVGFGENRIINGTNVLGLPYINRFLNDGLYSENINNYLTGEFVRVIS